MDDDYVLRPHVCFDMVDGEGARIHVFTTRMPADEYETLKAYAFFANTSVNDLVLRTVRSFLREATTDPRFKAMVQARRRFQEAEGK